MKKVNIFLACVLTILLATYCNSTRIASSWKEPNKQVTVEKLNKVLVVALFKTETTRRRAEDEMAGYLNGKGVVSYNYLDAATSNSNEEGIRSKIKADGFDGAVTMRLVDVDKEKTYNPGNLTRYPNYYRSFSSYYFRNWSYYQEPGYYSTTKTFTVETNVFSIKEEKIIWTSLTKTTNPEGVAKMTGEIAGVVYKQMVKEGFISK
jgi:hypothetical protein